jgi:DNA-binding PadR family transcriptional regulator
MSAKHALLGLMADRPAYPYELADRLQRRLGPAWAVNSGQVYQTMNRLAQDGLIERVDGLAPGRDGRHVFAITDRGREELDEWLAAAPGEVRLPRRPLRAKITLAGPDRLHAVLDQIGDYERECSLHLRELVGAHELLDVGRTGSRADDILLRLNLSADILQVEAEIQWARLARATISRLLEDDVVWPSTAGRAAAQGQQGSDRALARRKLFDRMSSTHLHSVRSELEESQGVDGVSPRSDDA